MVKAPGEFATLEAQNQHFKTGGKDVCFRVGLCANRPHGDGGLGFRLLRSRRELLAIMLGDRIFAAMRIDEVGECVGETEISRPDGALRGRSEEPEVRAFVRDEVCLWHPLGAPLFRRPTVAYKFG